MNGFQRIAVTSLLAIGIGVGIESTTSTGFDAAISTGTEFDPVISLPSRPLALPACSSATNDGPLLSSVSPTYLSIGESAFGVAIAPGSDTGYVTGGGQTSVIADLTTSPHPTAVLPTQGEGIAVTADGKYLLSAYGPVLEASRTAGQSTPSSIALQGEGGIEVVSTPDGKYAFVSLEGSRSIAVVRLSARDGDLSGSVVGTIPVGLAPVGLALSPDGRWLYSTSEQGGTGGRDEGSLRVISVAKAETHPGSSVVATVNAGCEPVRVVTSDRGAVVWVTARASDALLGFSSSALLHEPNRALIADVHVGAAPVGLAVAREGSRIVVADSDRFDAAGEHADLLVVDVAAALEGRQAVLGHFISGLFPRDVAATRDGGVVIAANFSSGTLEVVRTSELP